MRRVITVCLVAVFAGLLGAWLYADARYEYTLYAYYETGELFEYIDRGGVWIREPVPIYEPDNPAWVGVIRRISPLSLFVLGMAILYMFVPAIASRLKGDSYLPRPP